MLILHVTPSYWPALRYGGPIRSIHGLCKGLVRLGHRVFVLTTDIDGPGRLYVPTDRPVMLEGVEVRYSPVGWPRRITRAPALGGELARLLPEVDLVHLHAVWQWPTWVGARAAERLRVPYLISPHGMLVRELIKRKSSLAKKLWLALVERHTLARAAAIHCTSEIEARELRALGLDLAPVVVVPNGVDLPDHEPDRALVEALWEERSRGTRLLYLGRISWKKGIDRLLYALAALEGASLVIAGNDEEGLAPKLRALAGALGVAESVSFAGPVEGDRKWALLAGADVVVVPSLNENWGIVVTEAIGVGTPVVVTEDVGAGEIVREHDLGVVVDGSPHSLARAISELLADPEGRRRMGERGRRLIRERFSHDTVARRMAAVYDEILRTRRKFMPAREAIVID